MSNIVICERGNTANHAGPKARKDIVTILNDLGWDTRLLYRAGGGGLVDKFWSLPKYMTSWSIISRNLQRGDYLLIQFPIDMYQQLSLACVPSLQRMKRKGVHLFILIHDLDSLRGYKENVERGILSLADGLIAHNEKMRRLLLDKGYCNRIVSLEIFDYLTDCPLRNVLECQGVDIAGNMSPEKVAYVYRLHELDNGLQVNLFGPNFNQDASEISWYRGEFSPDELGKELKGRFGLVWDGDSLDTCSGNYGEYLKYNNPHKLSMYLAFGEPVIIWDQAAEAGFVREHGVGLTVSSLTEAFDAASSMSDSKYERYRCAAVEIGKLLRSGYFTKKAIRQLIDESEADNG